MSANEAALHTCLDCADDGMPLLLVGEDKDERRIARRSSGNERGTNLLALELDGRDLAVAVRVEGRDDARALGRREEDVERVLALLAEGLEAHSGVELERVGTAEVDALGD